MSRLSLAAAFAAALALPALASAHEGHAHKVMGTVTAVTASAIAVKTPKGESVSVSVGADTKFRKGPEAGTLADVAVGTRIVVSFTEEGGVKKASLVRVGHGRPQADSPDAKGAPAHNH